MGTSNKDDAGSMAEAGALEQALWAVAFLLVSRHILSMRNRLRTFVLQEGVKRKTEKRNQKDIRRSGRAVGLIFVQHLGRVKP